MTAPDRFMVIHALEGNEIRVFTGSLEQCEDWVALNGDSFSAGHFEIRPAAPADVVERTAEGEPRE